MENQALIEAHTKNGLVVSALQDTVQSETVGRMLSAYHDTEGSARLLAWSGEIRSIDTAFEVSKSGCSLFPYGGYEELEDADPFDLIEVMADIEEMDRVFLFASGSWREGVLVDERRRAFAWRTAC